MQVSGSASEEILRLPPPAAAYRTPLGIQRECEALAASHRGRLETAGWSRQGRPIPLARFGPEDPGGILLLSLIHASEWIGALALLSLSRELLESRPGISLSLLPICNPDGAARAEASALRGTWRFHRGNATGVDLNRNFPPTHRARGLWSCLPFYRPGRFPGSEPETEAIISVATRSRPRLAISFHSFGRWIFHAPGAGGGDSPSAMLHQEAIRIAGGAASIGYRSRPLARWSPWFRAYGTEIDFFDSIGSMAYLIEVSRGGFGQWGVGRLATPFYAFNPRDPDDDVRRTTEFGSRLVRAVMG